ASSRNWSSDVCSSDLAVAPGEIATAASGRTSEDADRARRPGIPLGRPGKAEEVPAVIAFLASPASGYVTGADWSVDGGMLQMGPDRSSGVEGKGLIVG